MLSDEQELETEMSSATQPTVLPAKSDSDDILCLYTLLL